MATLRVLREHVEAVPDVLHSLGIRIFSNWSHYDIALKQEDAIAESVHVNDNLMVLSYKMSNAGSEDAGQ